jgi:hypothetical protein
MPDTSSIYRPRRPHDLQYYQCVEDQFERFERVYDELFARKYGFFRPYVRQVIYRYLDCGILHNGFARVRCEECSHEYLLAFSCKRRHFCPSCHQKRVVEFGEYLCEEVLKISHNVSGKYSFTPSILAGVIFLPTHIFSHCLTFSSSLPSYEGIGYLVSAA